MTSKRQATGRVLFIAGGLLFSFAGGRYAMGAAAQDEARQRWEEQDARAAVSSARAAIGKGEAGALVAGEPVARLIIPKIGLDEIVLEGVTDDVMNGGPGHFPGSPLPGGPGNAIVSGHRDRHFKHLGDLAVGDTLETEAGSAATKWVVVSRRVVDKDAPALFPSRDSRLTLTTCWPIRYLGSAPDRLILTAKPVSGEKG